MSQVSYDIEYLYVYIIYNWNNEDRVLYNENKQTPELHNYFISQSLTVFCHKTLIDIRKLCYFTASLRYFYPFRYLPSKCNFESQVPGSPYLLSHEPEVQWTGVRFSVEPKTYSFVTTFSSAVYNKYPERFWGLSETYEIDTLNGCGSR